MTFRDLHPNIRLRFGLQFATTLANSMVMPFMVIFFSQKIGATITGLLLILLVCAGAAGAIVGGYYGDRLGRKKIIVFAEALIFVLYLLIGYCNSPWNDSPYLSGAFFMCETFLGAMVGPVVQAMILDVSSSENRKYIYSLSYWINNLSIAIGGIVGGLLFKGHVFELFMGLAAATLLSTLVTQFFVQETYVPKPKPMSATAGTTGKSAGLASNYAQVLKDKTFLLFLTAGVLILSLEQQLDKYISVRLAQDIQPQTLLAGWPFSFELDGYLMLGILRFENTLLVVLLATVLTKSLKRFADRRVLSVGMGMFTLGFAVLGFSESPWLLVAAMLVGTVGEVMYIPVKQAILGDLVPAEARGSYMAVNNFGGMAGMMLASVSVTASGFLNPWMMSGMFLAFGLTSIVLMRRVLPRVERRRMGKEGIVA